MDNNFNPGFDREKLAFLELANRGGGLDPIEYIYAGDASFESVLASYVKGGMFDINMLYVTNIDASDIITVTLEADIGTITTIYSENIYNKEKVTTKDLFVSDNIYFGTSSKDSKTLIYGSVEAHSGPWDITTTTMNITSGATELALGILSIDAGATTIATAVSSWVAGALSLNTPELAINAIASIAPLGYIQMYAGSSCLISAPTLNLGRDYPATLGASTNNINIKATLGIEASSGIEGSTWTTTSNTQILSDIGCSISAGESIDIIIKSLEPVGNEMVNIAGPNIVMEGTKKIYGNSDGSIAFTTQETETNNKMGLQIINKTIDYPIGLISLDAEYIKIGRDTTYANTEAILMTGSSQVWLTSGQRGSSASMILGPEGSQLSGLKTSIGYLRPDSDIGECQHLVLQSTIDTILSSKDIQIKNTDASYGNLQPTVSISTNTVVISSAGIGVADRNTASTTLESDHGITLNNKAPLTPTIISTTVQDININTGSVANINVSSNNAVNITGTKLVEIKSDTIGLNSTEVAVTSLNFPTPRFVEGAGAIAPVTGVGDCTFELVNIVICEAGVLKLADITVNIAFA